MLERWIEDSVKEIPCKFWVCTEPISNPLIDRYAKVREKSKIQWSLERQYFDSISASTWSQRDFFLFHNGHLYFFSLNENPFNEVIGKRLLAFRSFLNLSRHMPQYKQTLLLQWCRDIDWTKDWILNRVSQIIFIKQWRTVLEKHALPLS